MGEGSLTKLAGFTIIETLISITIFSLILGVSLNLLKFNSKILDVNMELTSRLIQHQKLRNFISSKGIKVRGKVINLNDETDLIFNAEKIMTNGALFIQFPIGTSHQMTSDQNRLTITTIFNDGDREIIFLNF